MLRLSRHVRTLLLVKIVIAAVAIGYYLAHPCEHVSRPVKRSIPSENTHRKPLISKRVEEQKVRYNLMEENDFHVGSTAECSLEYANAKKLPQDHPCVIKLIKELFIEPSPRSVPYKFRYPHPNSSYIEISAGQAQAVTRILNNQTGGFYVECGAADGESFTNSLHLEAILNWTGLLIEPDPGSFEKLIQANRKSWKLNACLSSTNYPVEVSFERAEVVGKVHGDKVDEEKLKQGKLANVQCFPLYSILLAHGRTSIDYFSLDVEGQEFNVLQTIPWHKVDIKVLTVEWEWVKEGQRAIIDFMKKNGYIHFGNIAYNHARDNVFVKDLLSDLRPDYEIYYRDGEEPEDNEVPLWKSSS